MTVSPWLEVATPHRDIADGTFQEALFAADLGLVAEGQGPDDYLYPKTFAQKTYLTKNLEAALVTIGDRLGGDTTAPGVLRLQTEFGGGKTHTLLAAYHCFGSPEAVADTNLGRDLAQRLKNGA
jgi:predicted AAA+ superfamily ATPase